MTCGIICRREIDDKPWPERFTHWDEPGPDWIDRMLVGLIGVILFVGGVAVLLTLAIGLTFEFVLAIGGLL